MTPPRLARAMLERTLPSRLADAVIGDLDELFVDECRRSPARARRAYWRRTAGAVWHLSPRRRRAATSTRSGDSVMSTLLKDLSHGLRLFTAQPGYAWAAVITLALAIGANTLIFTIVNVLVVKPLPIRDPATLGWILVSGPASAPDRAGVSLPEFASYRDEVRAFTQLAAWRRRSLTMRAGDEAQRVLGQVVTGDLQGLWGVAMARGRALTRADEAPGAPQVAVLSHRFWTRRFGQAGSALGSDVFVDGVRHAVVGIAGPDIELGNLAEIDVWLPYTGDPAGAPRTERGWRAVGRLRDRHSLSEAHAQVAAVAARLAREYPDTSREWTPRVGTTREALGGANTWLVLTLLSVVVGLLLLLACANIMNLLIGRLIGRRQELAVRTALGATRGRLVRQIVSESLLLGLAGGALGLALAAAGVRGMHALAAEPVFDQIAIDVRVLAFAAALSFLAPLAFAVLPALRLLKGDLRGALNDATARSVGGGTAARGRAALVLVQVSLAVTLLVVAGLVVQSMQSVIEADLGYDTAPLLTADIDVPVWKEPDARAALRLRQRLVERAGTIAGVEAAAMTTDIPALGFPAVSSFDIVGRDAGATRQRPSAGLTVVSTGYFTVMGIPIVAGRGFTPEDAAAPGAVVVVSQEAARRFWGDPPRALGQVLRLPGPDGQPGLEASVIGVSRDTANADLDRRPEPAIVALDEHLPARTMHLVVRAAAPARLAPALRAAIKAVDPDVPADQLRTVAERFADENSSNQLLSAMFATFALVALLLATAGLYGVISYAVSQRTPEIAVRMALGASRHEIARDVVGGSLRLAVAGTAIGLAGAYALAQTLTSLLFGVTTGDPATYAGAGAAALLAAVAASWIPMRRAAGIDPIRSLRQT